MMLISCPKLRVNVKLTTKLILKSSHWKIIAGLDKAVLDNSLSNEHVPKTDVIICFLFVHGLLISYAVLNLSEYVLNVLWGPNKHI